jgi:hypothetical protein
MKRNLIAIVVCLIVFTGFSSASVFASSCNVVNHTVWSSTTPKLNLTHVFEGEINKKGKAVGFHSRPGAKDPAGARVVKITAGPNAKGIYTADIQVCNGKKWLGKFSSFFPDAMSKQQVIDLILRAHKAAGSPLTGKWGATVDAITVNGYMCSGNSKACPKGAINTAYPVY